MGKLYMRREVSFVHEAVNRKFGLSQNLFSLAVFSLKFKEFMSIPVALATALLAYSLARVTDANQFCRISRVVYIP